MPTKSSTVTTNPTAFFLSQPTDTSQETREKINDYVKRLINLKSCVLCKQEYDFTDKIPRILVHCGHTICTLCLRNFHKNRRVRCPLCLKLIKNIDILDRLPVNHTIFSKMMEERKDKFHRINGKQRKFSDFTKVSMPNRDKKQQVFDCGIDQNDIKTKAAKSDFNNYVSKELFEPTPLEENQTKKHVVWDYSNNMTEITNLKSKLTDYQNLFDKTEADESLQDIDTNVLDKKFEIPEFDYDEEDAYLAKSVGSV